MSREGSGSSASSSDCVQQHAIAGFGDVGAAGVLKGDDLVGLRIDQVLVDRLQVLTVQQPEVHVAILDRAVQLHRDADRIEMDYTFPHCAESHHAPPSSLKR